jgi:hypothetical protein
MANLAGVVQLLKKEQDRLTNELHGIGAALAAFGKSYGKQQELDEDSRRQDGQGLRRPKERVGRKLGRVQVRAETEALLASERCQRRLASE